MILAAKYSTGMNNFYWNIRTLPGVCGKYCGALNHNGKEAIATPSLQLIAQGAGQAQD